MFMSLRSHVHLILVAHAHAHALTLTLTLTPAHTTDIHCNILTPAHGQVPVSYTHLTLPTIYSV